MDKNINININTVNNLSIIIPAKNEAASLTFLLPQLKEKFPSAEIIIVNDGSTDNTAILCSEYNIILKNHLYSIGNGGAIKSGARAATRDILLFMDADGQHQVEDIPHMLATYQQGYDMVVGSRISNAQASQLRSIGNHIFNWLASHIVNHPVLDLTSGFRVVNSKKFHEFLHILPNGFSYPTTITLAFFRTGYLVHYTPITVKPRQGKSHLHPLSDGLRFFIIIYKITTLYSPLKVFIPLSLFYFIAGLINYSYTYWVYGRFTNMSALFLSTAVMIFLIGLVSEQITTLIFQKRETS